MDIRKTITYWMVLMTMMLWAASSVGAEEKAAEPKDEAPKAEEPAKKPETPAPSEVDISDIQNQYWKAHDKEFEVIQNKQYTKAGRVEVAPLFGIYQRVDYQDTKTLGASLQYHFSEVVGAELMSYKMFTSDSHVISRFKESTGSTIEYNPEKWYAGIGPVITPIYGKFSLFGKKISHFDLYVTPSLGLTKTLDTHLTPGVAVGQKFWISPKWNFRVEYRWMRYNDRIPTSQGVTATKNGGPGYFDDTTTNQNPIFGISYLFN